MASEDNSLGKIQEYCIKNGFADHVVRGGLPYLVEEWEKISTRLEREGDDEIDDYLNDVDTRGILDELLPLADPSQREIYSLKVAEADRKFKIGTLPTQVCVWGEENAKKHSWSPEGQWWYFRRPRKTKENWSLDNY